MVDTARFGTAPAALIAWVGAVSDGAKLDAWIDRAATVNDLAALDFDS